MIGKELIINYFEGCALNLKNDGSKDRSIHCFKENQPCAAGYGCPYVAIFNEDIFIFNEKLFSYSMENIYLQRNIFIFNEKISHLTINFYMQWKIFIFNSKFYMVNEL